MSIKVDGTTVTSVMVDNATCRLVGVDNEAVYISPFSTSDTNSAYIRIAYNRDNNIVTTMSTDSTHNLSGSPNTYRPRGINFVVPNSKVEDCSITISYNIGSCDMYDSAAGYYKSGRCYVDIFVNTKSNRTLCTVNVNFAEPTSDGHEYVTEVGKRSSSTTNSYFNYVEDGGVSVYIDENFELCLSNYYGSGASTGIKMNTFRNPNGGYSSTYSDKISFKRYILDDDGGERNRRNIYVAASGFEGDSNEANFSTLTEYFLKTIQRRTYH